MGRVSGQSGLKGSGSGRGFDGGALGSCGAGSGCAGLAGGATGSVCGIDRIYQGNCFCREKERGECSRFFVTPVVQQKRHGVEGVAGADANPAGSTKSMEPKPQQTGIGLLIRHGEVATTSGSTNSLLHGVIAACRVLTPTVLVRVQVKQPIRICDLPAVGNG